MLKQLSTVLVMGFAIIGVSSVAGAQCADPPAGMVAWWPFDENVGVKSGDIAGSIVNDGTWHGGPTISIGKVRGALRFDLDEQFVEVPDQDEIDFGQGGLTIDAWIQTSTTSDIQVIVDKRSGPDSSPIGFVFFIINGVLGFQLDDGEPFTGNIWTTGPVLTDGAWHHVAVTVARPSGMVQFFADGTLLGRDPASSPILVAGNVSNDASLLIGNRRTLSGRAPFHGQLDEVELFSRALDPVEIQTIFTAGASGKCKPLCLIGSGGALGQIFDVNPETGAGSSVRGGIGGYLVGIDFSPDGKLYGITDTPDPGSLVTINPATGEIVGAPVALSQAVGLAFAIDPTTGILYGVGELNELCTIDPTTGVVTTVGVMDLDECMALGLAFDEGNLYVSSTGGCFFGLPPGLHAVDKHNANASGVTAINPQIDVYALAFDPLTHGLYCSNGTSLFQLSPATGTLTTIGPIGVGTNSLAFLPRSLCSRVTAVETSLSPAHVNLLVQNRPNPFNPETIITYSLATPGHVAIRIYDVAGRLVRTLVDRVEAAGVQSARWEGRSDIGGQAASGVYFYRITYPDGSHSAKQMTLLR